MKLIHWPFCPFDEILLNFLFSPEEQLTQIDTQFIHEWRKHYEIVTLKTDEDIREASCRAILYEFVKKLFPKYINLIKPCYFIGIERETGEIFSVENIHMGSESETETDSETKTNSETEMNSEDLLSILRNVCQLDSKGIRINSNDQLYHFYECSFMLNHQKTIVSDTYQLS